MINTNKYIQIIDIENIPSSNILHPACDSDQGSHDQIKSNEKRNSQTWHKQTQIGYMKLKSNKKRNQKKWND